jgi:hypothetical protein
MKLRRRRIFKGLALAFAIAAFTASTAQAKPIPASAASQYAPQQLRALELRSAGMNQRYVSTASASTPKLTPDQLRALVTRFQGTNVGFGLTGSTVSHVQSSNTPAVVSTSNGFDWGDAFVGAAATFGTVIVLIAAFTGLRRRTQPLGV